MNDMKRWGERIFEVGLLAGLAAMFLPGHTPVGPACWAVALFVGLPLWLAGYIVQRRQKSGGYTGIPR